MMLCYADVDESRVDLAAACLAGAESAGGLESSDNWAFVLHALFSLFLSFPAMMMMMIMMMLMIVMMMMHHEHDGWSGLIFEAGGGGGGGGRSRHEDKI